MFERFTQPSRRVVVLAQEEAGLLNHNYIGTEHILLGLIHEEDGVAARAIVSLGLTLEMARERVRDIIGPGPQPPSGHIPFTPRAKKVLELSLREAIALKDDYISTEHILLGLIQEPDGVGAQILDAIAPLPAVRERVLAAAAAAAAGADDPLTAEWRGPGLPGGAFPRVPRGVVRVRPEVVTEFRDTLATISGTLAALDQRLTGIERQLGITPPTSADAAAAEAAPESEKPAEPAEDTTSAPGPTAADETAVTTGESDSGPDPAAADESAG
jgi:Clp amino terminal domain, pathogenicity island component